MSNTSQRSRRSFSPRAYTILLGMVVLMLLACTVVASVIRHFGSANQSAATLVVAYSPEKQQLFDELVRSFNASKPRLPNGGRVTLVAQRLDADEMVRRAGENSFQAMSPDSSVWLSEIDRRWMQEHDTDVGLVGETVHFMASPVVVAMWREVAEALGYPEKELGWKDLLETAASDPQFRWSHPSPTTASGLLATLAVFYAGSGVTRGLTMEQAAAEATLAYVAQVEGTVKHYGEGELAVMRQVEEQGRAYLDAFVVQEQLVVQHNLANEDKLVAVYPLEGTLWEDHPLVLLEHPDRSDHERQAFALLRDYFLLPETQTKILRLGYRPADLSIALDQPDSPIKADNGVNPSQPHTTLQIPSPSVVEMVKNAWYLTKRRANIYLVVDTSGSMKGQKLADAQDALRVFVGQIQASDDRVALLSFADRAHERVTLAPLGDGRDRLAEAIDSLEAGGNTALLDAVDRAAERLEGLRDTERINAIVVLTDGIENHSTVELSDLTERLREAYASDLPVVVFCIAYGRDADIDALQDLSDASGGFTAQGEIETIGELYRTLSTYF